MTEHWVRTHHTEVVSITRERSTNDNVRSSRVRSHRALRYRVFLQPIPGRLSPVRFPLKYD